MKASLSERIREYVDKIPGAVSGQNGHTVTFHVACVLIIGFALSLADALVYFLEWNSKCQPPWTEAELRHKLEDAQKAPSIRPRGYLLDGGRARSPATRAGETHPKPASCALPPRTDFGPGTAAQVRRLARNRPYYPEGLDWASERGILVFGRWRGLECFGITDRTGRVLELRRLDGQLFPAVPGTSLSERKCHAVKGSQKQWPVGIFEAQPFPAIALVEGIPDLLTAHYVALWEQASHHKKRDVRCAPVAMLSSSPAIHPEALPLFRGKHVRIFAHSEAAGLRAAARWQAQLEPVGVAADVFDFSVYRRTDGSRVKDLWEFEHDLHSHERSNPATWRIMP